MKQREDVLTFYIQQDLQKAFINYSKDKEIKRSTILNEMLRQELHEQGYI